MKSFKPSHVQTKIIIKVGILICLEITVVMLLLTNFCSVVEFQRWWVLKSKLFGQESTFHQGKVFKKFLRVMTVCQKVPKLYFQSQFRMSKNNCIFSKKKITKEYQFRRPLFIKNFFFLNSIFEPLYFLKLRPIFDRLSLLVGIF